MIEEFGWSAELQEAFAPLAARGLTPARIVAQHRDVWRAVGADGERTVRLAGRLTHDAAAGEWPVVGDWAGVTDDIIHALMPRRSTLSRVAAGGVGRQVLCANVDRALLVMSLNEDFNPRRLERYLAAVRDGGAAPAIVLTKADLRPDAEVVEQALAPIAADAPVFSVCALTGDGLDRVRTVLAPRQTGVLLGSSGAGKSTLLNALMGEAVMDTGAIRDDDDKGRHTTRHRALFRLPNGGLLIDTPGLRELALAVAEETIDAVFDDVTALFSDCRFNNCSHEREPGCAVQAALESGALTPDRWRAYQKLQRETAFEARRTDAGLRAETQRKWKQINKNQRAKDALRKRNAEWED